MSLVTGASKAPTAVSPFNDSVGYVRAQLRSALLDARNPDGGWGYSRAHRSRLEPTSWTLLALSQAEGGIPDVSPLVRWQPRDHWLLDVLGVSPNITFNAIAALTLAQAEAGEPLSRALIQRLSRARGETYVQAPELRQNNGLAAWSWIQGTISWVEPTAWCLLVLKKHRHTSDERIKDRIADGEAFLVDRACAAGGWNYGNPNVYGTDLIPHVPTTAIALLAFQDRQTHPVVRAAVARLQQDAESERSPMALALSAMALRRHGVSTERLESMLTDACLEWHQQADGIENLHASALALCALSEIDRPLTALTL